jgi:ABC-type lipoprotein release transport system permease subunit
MNLVYVKIGILNVFRNKRRSFLTALVIGVGLMSLILAHGFILGMENYMIHTITEDFLGHAQIHNQEFRNTNKTKFVIENFKDLENNLNTDKNLRVASFRTISPALIASPEGSNQIALFGINPESEKISSRLFTHIIEGEYLDLDKKSIIIGTRLAKKLSVEVGSKVIVTLSSIKGENLSQELFRVKGIFSFSSREFDNQMAFINLNMMQTMLGCENCIHEISLKFDNLNDLNLHFLDYKKKYTKNSTVFENWRELVPNLDSALKLNDISMAFMIILLGVLVGADIVNTLFMALFERKYEFGVLLAIGTRRSTLFAIVMYESITLAIGSILIGSILTAIFGGYLATKGIDYGGISFSGVSLREPIYFVFALKPFLLFSGGLIIFTMIISIYPVLKLLQVYPSKALKIM